MILGVPPPSDASDSSMIANADVRRNVPLQFYKHRCPKSQVVTIDASGAPKALMDGKDLMQWWVDKLNTVKDVKCVELDMGEEMKFTSYEPSSPHSYGAPPTAYNPTFPNLVAVHLRRGDYIRHCPRLASYGSMYMGINRLPGLEDRFRPWLAEDDGDEDDSGHALQRHPHQQDKEGNKSEDSLVRDGQMKQNVMDLDFENWTPLTADTSVVSKEAVERYYERHCFPSVTQIVKKLRGVREGYERQHSISGLVHQTGNVVQQASSGSTTAPPPPGAATKHILTHLFLLTNASPSSSFLVELKASLVKDGWEAVVTTSELDLDWTQEYVRMGVDMVVATGAEVFVGNGFSSGSSNTVLLRTAAGAPMNTNHFL
ncbi:hypothetical protein BDN72DRAFT_847164 [Pluteus cervinus]|uniref:Uncharacterized protein n=1 Tax=Pluteus cervinus TaxID=181527 RepID=A0ACD3ADD9_9AGAR|nr:hypothetical protein BDN72DRAFT_847164 [Pluteus cervinus]